MKIFLKTTQLLLIILSLSCTNSRFKSYRVESFNVLDKTIQQQQYKFEKEKNEFLQKIDKIREKLLQGDTLSPYEIYDTIMYNVRLNTGGFEFQLQEIDLPGNMNPRWIEIAQDYILFENADKEIIKKYRIISIDKQKGIDNAEWYFKIDDSEIERAVLYDNVIQLFSYPNKQYDYTYSFYTKK